MTKLSRFCVYPLWKQEISEDQLLFAHAAWSGPITPGLTSQTTACLDTSHCSGAASGSITNGGDSLTFSNNLAIAGFGIMHVATDLNSYSVTGGTWTNRHVEHVLSHGRHGRPHRPILGFYGTQFELYFSMQATAGTVVDTNGLGYTNPVVTIPIQRTHLKA